MMLLENAYISLGSNVEPERWLPAAAAQLGRLGSLKAVSRAYESPAFGSPERPHFLNAAAIVATELSVHEVRAGLRVIEASLGRVRGADKFAPRTIDLDLCLYGALVLTDNDLTLPHPDVLERTYVAGPLAELEPGYRHPVTGETLAVIAARLGAARDLSARRDLVLVPARAATGGG